MPDNVRSKKITGSTSPVSLAAGIGPAAIIIVQNTGSTTVDLGGSTVTAGQGIQLLAGETFTSDRWMDLYGIGSGSWEVRVMEVK